MMVQAVILIAYALGACAWMTSLQSPVTVVFMLIYGVFWPIWLVLLVMALVKERPVAFDMGLIVWQVTPINREQQHFEIFGRWPFL